MSKGASYQFTVRIPADIYEKMQDKAWDTRVSKVKFVELSIENYLKYLENMKNELYPT